MYDPNGDQCVCVIVGNVCLAYAALSQVPYRRYDCRAPFMGKPIHGRC